MKIAIRFILVLISFGSIAEAQATDLEIRGNVSYQTTSDQSNVRIRVETIVNNSTNTTSGTIHIRLFATPTPEIFQSGYTLADVNLGTFASNNGRLAPGAGYSNIEATVPFNRPPDGNYYLHLYISEFPDLSTVLDYQTFSGTVSWGNNGGGAGGSRGGADDHSDFFETATPINANGTMPGAIETAGDTDMFRVNLSSAGRLSLRTSGGTDTVGTLYDASRRELATDDDSGAGTNFAFEAEVPAGTYYVRVAGFSDFNTGPYDLAASFTPSAGTGNNASGGGGTNSGGTSSGGGASGPLFLLLMLAVSLVTRRRQA